MSTYESGYDPEYGYNRNAFATHTVGTAFMGKVVKLVVSPIGLVSEAINTRRARKNVQSSTDTRLAGAKMTGSRREDTILPFKGRDAEPHSPLVALPADQADQLIATGQAVSADGQTATHQLVPEDDNDADDYNGIDNDVVDWTLDEAALRSEEAEPEFTEEGYGDKHVERLAYDTKPATSSIPNPSKPQPKLPFPVILPQRRPGTKSRGFVRAYAPVLEESGIDQRTFLSFLKNLYNAAQASPIFDVVMVATAVVGFYPDPLVAVGVQAVQIAAGLGQEAQERWRLNKFLDLANKDLFTPRGLFAMIVTYKPGDSEQPEVSTKTIDLGATAMAKYGDGLLPPNTNEEEQDERKRLSELRGKMQRFRVASGETHGEAEMPVTCAPLVFPALDAAALDAAALNSKPREGNDESVAGTFKAKSKSASKFISDYYDRRAQATYSATNPDSTLTAQVAPVAPKFKSRFADPNDATNQHFFTLITGGRFKAEPLGARRRWQRAQRKAAQKRAQGIKDNPSKRWLSENVLYLMIVNMPTPEELEKARREIHEQKAAGKRVAL